MAIKLYRKLRRRVCRYILSFERCPIDCRKNRKELFVNRLSCFLLTAATVAFLLTALIGLG